MTKKKILWTSITLLPISSLIAIAASCTPTTKKQLDNTDSKPDKQSENVDIKTTKLDNETLLNNFIAQISVKRPMSNIQTNLTYNINKIKNEETKKDPNFSINNKSVFETNQHDISTTDFSAFVKGLNLQNAMTFYTDAKTLDIPNAQNLQKPSFVPFNSFIADYFFDSNYEQSGFLDYDQQKGQIRYFSLVADPMNTSAVYQAIPSFLSGFKKTYDHFFIFDKSQFNWTDEQKKLATYHVVAKNVMNNKLYETDATFNYANDKQSIIYTRLDLKTTDVGNYVIEQIYDPIKPGENLLLAKNIGFSIYGKNNPIKETASIRFNAFVEPVRSPYTGKVELKRNYTFGNVLVDEQVAKDDKTNRKVSPLYFAKPLSEIDLYELDHIFFPILYTNEPIENFDMQYVVEKDSEVPQQLNFTVKYIHKKNKTVVEPANSIAIRYTKTYDPEVLTSASVECDLKAGSKESIAFINKYEKQDLTQLSSDQLLDIVNEAFSIYYTDIDLEKYSIKTIAKLLPNNQVELFFYASFKQSKENIQTSNQPNILIGKQKIALFQHAK
ncbi:hypothetical protein [Ureaplasma zalophigenitalium]|uniref:Lipoprotein n=1 Tax=Ureaplasma zalophigenitalium TaxID=907723 RepID=A0ABT3BPP7_9BACT|nr:hypothetical protein [Ureaplasma zalophigenitalium]MCV3754224.1 hypothetical protein [Ureaplasma zalophigenitalium]